MDTPVNFSPYDGDLMGLPTNENHFVFRWHGPGKILFSVARQGNAASIHFASNKNGLRYIKKAVDEFVQFVFWLFDWCTMVIGKIIRPSIERMVKKIGFQKLIDADKGSIYVRPR